MYNPGAYVMKVNEGVCQIVEIITMQDPGSAKGKDYYLLSPMEAPTVKVYVPVDRAEKSIRPVMSQEEAEVLIARIGEIQAAPLQDERHREQQYRQALHSGDPERLVAMLKQTYLRNHKRSQQGKKNTAVDSRFFQMAEDRLYAELAFALQTDRKGVCALIQTQIKNK